MVFLCAKRGAVRATGLPVGIYKSKALFLWVSLIGILWLQGCGEYHEFRHDPAMGDARTVTVLPKYQEEYAKLNEVRERYHNLPLPKIDSEHAQIHVRMGIIHYDSGNMVEARFNLERSIEMHHDSAEAHLYLGRVLTENGDDPGAVKEFLTALGIDPKMIEVHKFLGDAYQKLGLVDKAKREYETYRKSQPETTSSSQTSRQGNFDGKRSSHS